GAHGGPVIPGRGPIIVGRLHIVIVIFDIGVEDIFLNDRDELAALDPHLRIILPVDPAIGRQLVAVDRVIAVIGGIADRVAARERAPRPVGAPAADAGLRLELAPAAI